MSFWDNVDSVGRRTLGRANAGKASIAARALRITGAVLATGVVVGSIVATGGLALALPLWGLIGLGVAMAINSAAVPLSWVGNHMKVLQYEDAEGELLADILSMEHKRAKTSATPSSSLPEKLMKASRKASDVNGMGGTFLSALSAAATLGLYTPAAPAAAGIMLASRASASVSAGINVPITRNRIAIHKEKLAQFQALYVDSTKALNPKHAALSKSIVEDVFGELSIAREGHLNQWLYFSLYKSIFSHPLLSQGECSDARREAITLLAREMVEPLLKNIPPSSSREVDKERLKSLDTCEHGYSSKEKAFKDKLAPLDAMAVLVMKLQDQLTEHCGAAHHTALSDIAAAVTKALRLNAGEGLTKQLQFHIRKTLSGTANDFVTKHRDSIIQNLCQTLRPYCTTHHNAVILDTSKLQRIGLPEGAEKRVGYESAFLPHYHLTQLGVKMGEQLTALNDPGKYHSIQAAETIINGVVKLLRLNPANFYSQQFYGIVSHSIKSMEEHRSLTEYQQKECILHLSKFLRPYLKQETTRPKRFLKLREVPTGYNIFNKQYIIDSLEDLPDKNKYAAYDELFKKAIASYQQYVPAMTPKTATPEGPSAKVIPLRAATIPNAVSVQKNQAGAVPLSVRPSTTGDREVVQHYIKLKASLITDAATLTHEHIQHQQEKLDRFRENAPQFSVVKQETRNGQTVIIWDDPDPKRKGKADYQITYYITASTGQMVVKYGRDASAIIAADSNIESNIGVRLLEIVQGKQTEFGDRHNQKIDVAMSGLAGGDVAVAKSAKNWAATTTTGQTVSRYAR
jgi:hypothetical protein